MNMVKRKIQCIVKCITISPKVNMMLDILMKDFDMTASELIRKLIVRRFKKRNCNTEVAKD